MRKNIRMENHIILLHGALGSMVQFEELNKALSKDYYVHAFNFMGHGGDVIPGNMKMDDFVNQLEAYITQNIPEGTSLTLFGYSMGGYAALLLASKHTCKIDRIITLGTKLLWNEEIAAKELSMLDAKVIEEKLPDFAKELQIRHHPQDWKLLLQRTGEMMMDLGTIPYLNDETFSQIKVVTKLMIGDKDRMVTLDETVHAFKRISGASLAVLPSTPHPFDKVKLDRLIFEILN
jgi:pimeloyl-ACP methyl ester carboxylesterase